MRMSSREKKLILFLSIAVLIYASYTFLIKPQLNEISSMKDSVVVKENQILELEVAEAKIPSLESKIQDLGKVLKEVLSSYLGNVEQEDVILLINEILLRSDVEVNELSFAPFGGSSEEFPIDAEIMTVQLPFNGEYEDVLSLLSSFWRFDQNIFLSTLSISADNETAETEGEETTVDSTIGERDSIVSGSASIVFMRVNDEYAANEPIFEWFLDEGYDVGNPFLARDRNMFFNSNYYYIGKDVEFYNKEYVPFADIKDHWIESFSNIFGENGYISGDEYNRFYPDANMTRMEFIMLLDKLYRWPMAENPLELTSFNDSNLVMTMDPNEYKILQKAVNSGYVYGFEDNTLRPYDKISYSELEFFSKRIPTGINFTWNEFADVMEDEVGFTSRGRDNINRYATKAEIIYMLYYLNR
ncbi:MAG: S-layer homology domain-containing protein [Clostridiales bacterium]|nr:S-layer homology domain-containing protein [Clostridiales bacterium]